METPSKDEKSLPMFTPKNSEGSQRVIKQIMVIDPNKLRVAGLDLKMAEALKKSKSSKGNTTSSRTKEDKLALAKTLLNRKLKQMKSPKEGQNQNISKEQRDSPQKAQSNIAVLQSLLSSPRTVISPALKQPHTMLVSIKGNDQRPGSVEMNISNKPYSPQDKAPVEQIPKASIKMTKPMKVKNEPQKMIESMVISPEVKFEVKRKSLPIGSKQICSDAQSNLPKVIESKVLSPEEKIDMKTLCGNSTKPVPATVRIEITKSEVVASKVINQMDTFSALNKPKEYMIAPQSKAFSETLTQTASEKAGVELHKPDAAKNVPSTLTVQQKPQELVLSAAAKSKSENVSQSGPKVAPKKIETSEPLIKAESAVDFINNLQMSNAQKCEKKSKSELNVEPSVTEDATSFLMSLFAQQSLSATVSQEVKNVENAVMGERTKSNVSHTSMKPETNSSAKGHRRSVKPVPITKQKPRCSSAAKVDKTVPASQIENLSEPAPIGSAKEETMETNETCNAFVASSEQLEKTIESCAMTSVSTQDYEEEGPKKELLNPLHSTNYITSNDSPDELNSKGCAFSVSKFANDYLLKEEISKEVNSGNIASDSKGTALDPSDSITKKLSEESAVKQMEGNKMSTHIGEVAAAQVIHSGEGEQSSKVEKLKNSDLAVKPLDQFKPVLVDETTAKVAATASGNSLTENVKLDFVQKDVQRENEVKETDTPKGDFNAEANSSFSDIPTENSNLNAISGAAEEGNQAKTLESIEKGNLKTEAPPAPVSRRKGKKSVPVLIAKLKKSRKPSSLQEEPKENQTPVVAVDDKSSVPTNESIEEETANNSVQTTRAEKSTRNAEKINKKDIKSDETDKTPHHTSKEQETTLPRQALPQESTMPESSQKQYQPATRKSITKEVEKEKAMVEVVLNKSVTPAESYKSEAELEQEINKSTSLAESEKSENELNPKCMNRVNVDVEEAVVKVDSIKDIQTEGQTYLESRGTMGEASLEMLKTETALEPVKKISSEAMIGLQDEESSMVSTPHERHEEISSKQLDCKPDALGNLIPITDEICQRPSEDTPLKLDLIKNTQECQKEEKAYTSPLKSTMVEKNCERKTPRKQKEKGKRQTKDDITSNLTEQISVVSEDEAKSIPFSRVRKKSLESKEDTTSPSKALPNDVEKSNESMHDEAKQAYTEYLALTHIESPKAETSKGKPKLKKELSSKIKESNEKLQSRGKTEDKAVHSSSWDIFDGIRENIKIETAPASKSKEMEIESDEFENQNSDFEFFFQDDIAYEDTATVEKTSTPDSPAGFDALKSPEKISLANTNKALYQSKDDLDFLGFNEKEIEEGQQLTSLRLSQSEDVSPLKPTSQSETPVIKKTAPPVKKTPLSAGKKLKADQKNWKKNSAKSLQNWLKSSDKDTSLKEDDTSQKETTNEGDNDEKKESPLPDLKSAQNHSVVTEDKVTLTAETPISSEKKKMKQEKVTKKNTKPEKPSRKSHNSVKDVGDLKESVNDSNKVFEESTQRPEKPVKDGYSTVVQEKTAKDQDNAPSPLCLAESKTTNKSSVRGRKSNKTKTEIREEIACTEDALNCSIQLGEQLKLNNSLKVKSLTDTPSLPLSETPSTIPKELPSATVSATTSVTHAIHKATLNSPPDTKATATSNTTFIRSQRKKGASSIEGSCAFEGESVPMPDKKMELDNSLLSASKRKLETKEVIGKDSTQPETATPETPRQKRKYTRRSGVTATPTEKTPKTGRSKKNAKSEECQEPAKVEPADGPSTPLTTINPRKRKALKDDTEILNKVAHISADIDFQFSTPTPKRRGPKKKIEVVDSPDVVITPKAKRKYKNATEFNPRLLLIRRKEELKSDAPLEDLTLQTVPKSKDDVQCALCMGYTPKKKWLQHVSDHYGVGWVVGTPPPLNITCRSAVLSYMIEFFKTSKVKGLNCRMCQVLRRSALGLLTHIEQCCLTQEELKESRVLCEHCNKEYSKSSLPVHMRSCPELWKKNKAQNETEQEASEEGQEVVLSNTGRLKRKSVIKAENKFKDMDTVEFIPEEMIKHIPQPRTEGWEAAWQRDIKSFGKGFCVEKKCQFTAETVEELRKHCQPRVCPQFVQPGFHCLKCKYFADNMEDMRSHVIKHQSKANEDFQDSGDEAVISHESSSEDGSSGDEGVSEDGSVDNEGNDKRKPKKKAKPSRQRARNHTPKRNVPIRDIRKLVPPRVQKVTSEVAKLHQGFIEQNYSREPLFGYATPVVSETIDDGVESYFSKSPISPKFTLKGFKKPFVNKLGETRIEADKWQQLQRLNGMASKCEHVVYLGGPVKAIAWVPIVASIPSAYQYLASVTRKEQNKFSRFLQPKQSRSLVYIHRYKVDDTERNRIVGELYYALAIDDGPIHCIDFLPSGGYDPESNRLGLLAVGTVNSEVKIYSLPLNVQKRDCDIFPILRVEPSFILGLEMEETEDTSSDCHRSQCTSISWSQFAGHNHIIAGYLNGFLAIWDITEDDDNLNRFLVNGIRKFVPISYFWTMDDRIKRVTAHYDRNGLRWLVVCNIPRRLVFYDVRELNRPLQIMEERTKNECNAVDWPVVWANPAFALGDSLPTHGNCLNSISPSSLAYISKKFEKFCCGVIDLHFNPWNNMYAAGAENGDIQVTPLRDTVLDVGLRRKKDEKILTSLDIVPLNGGEVAENVVQSSRLLDTDYSNKFGIVFGPIQSVIGVKTPQLYSTARIPPPALTRLTRVNQVRFNPNQRTNTFLAVGYANGMVRILMNKWEDPLKAAAAYSEAPVQTKVS